MFVNLTVRGVSRPYFVPEAAETITDRSRIQFLVRTWAKRGIYFDNPPGAALDYIEKHGRSRIDASMHRVRKEACNRLSA